MPSAPPTFKPAGAQTESAYDRERRSLSATRKLYGTAAWRRIAAAQLRAEPLCAFCLPTRAVAATTCDHVTPHRGDVAAFWRGPFQSLCTPCHSSAKQRAEARG